MLQAVWQYIKFHWLSLALYLGAALALYRVFASKEELMLYPPEKADDSRD
ncbi:hypothetical protein J31TS4_22260 [Paenibacillus sp. J31TS4]|nr:hypothetical protein [Paenibacillus sp. J31TS4]GIP38946.1 hypothetical protein J31TS4_22260 [Paenibacillus sp. J31TS4]